MAAVNRRPYVGLIRDGDTLSSSDVYLVDIIVDVVLMIQFLTTQGTSYHIEKIVREAERGLTLVSPYLQLSQTLYERLRDADRRGVRVTLIYGKSELRADQLDLLDSLNGLQLYFSANLHAKCYYNEQELIITSMNLYEFSEKNNREMGVLATQDESVYDEACAEVESIRVAAQERIVRRTNLLNGAPADTVDAGDDVRVYASSAGPLRYPSMLVESIKEGNAGVVQRNRVSRRSVIATYPEGGAAGLDEDSLLFLVKVYQRLQAQYSAYGPFRFANGHFVCDDLPRQGVEFHLGGCRTFVSHRAIFELPR